MYRSFPQGHYNKSETAMPIIRETAENQYIEEEEEKKCENAEAEQKLPCDKPQNSIFGSLKSDDIILLGIILILLLEDTGDIVMFAVLGMILLF